MLDRLREWLTEALTECAEAEKLAEELRQTDGEAIRFILQVEGPEEED